MNESSRPMEDSSRVSPRVVVTGAGMACSLGLSRQAAWEAACLGQCGVKPSPELTAQGMAEVKAGQAPDLPADFAPSLTREARYLRWALIDALREAGFDQVLPCEGKRVAMVLATTLHGMPAAGRFFRTNDTRELATLLAGVTRKQATSDLPVLDELGLAVTTCNACASGLASIAMGAMLLQSNQYDMVIAAGYDTLSEYAQAGFGSLRLVSPTTQRPFAHTRNGLKLGEGYGALILQRETDVAKNTQPLAHIAGWGEATDAYHLSHPHPEGAGAAAALTQALTAAAITPDQLNLIVSHATATPDNDAAEYKAVAAALGEHLSGVPCCVLKSHLGHTLGGAGAVELIMACEMLARQLAPPAANVTQSDITFAGLDVITDMPRAIAGDNAVCLSAGFGGANVAVAIARADDASGAMVTAPSSFSTSSHDARDAVITGCAFVGPASSAHQDEAGLTDLQMLSRMMGDVVNANETRALAGQIDEALLDALIDAQRARRVSRYVKLTLAATLAACADAQLSADPSRGEFHDAAALLATTHGSVDMSVRYYRQLVDEGHHRVSPLYFAEGVPNAGAAHLAMTLGLHGPCQTLIGSATTSLDALALAKLGIAQGRWDRVIVTAAEEAHPLVHDAYAHSACAMPDQPMHPLVDAGVALVLESRASAMARSANILARVEDVASITWQPGDAKQALQRLQSLMRTTNATSSTAAHWFSTADATPALQKLELQAMQHVVRAGDASMNMSALLGRCFSVSSLAAIAIACAGWQSGAKWATMDHACVIASDFTGQSSLARITRESAAMART